MSIEFEVFDWISAAPEVIYHAWLDSRQHSLMTGGKAETSSELGGSFSAWDGYISGKNLKLEPPFLIIQSWRTSEFDEDDEDSLLEIHLILEDSGTRIKIKHSNLPEHGMQYQQGWINAYFDPMKTYFG